MKGCLGFVVGVVAALILGVILLMIIRSDSVEREATISVKAKIETLIVEMLDQSRKLKSAGYSLKQINAANFRLLEKAYNTWTDAEKRVFYKASTQAFRASHIERLKSYRK